MRQRTEELYLRVGAEFSLARMVTSINAFYGECMATAHGSANGARIVAHPAE
jgi:hypothetical protein